jgi:hypothetical protein
VVLAMRACAAATALLIASSCTSGDGASSRSPALAPGAPPAGSGGGNPSSDSSFGNATMMPGPATPIVGARAPATPSSTHTPRERMELDECPGAVSQDAAGRLRDPNVQPGGSQWLYPYQETVFPRGLVSPLLQWSKPAAGASAVFMRLRSMYLDYQICLPLAEPMRIRVPQAAWDLAAAQSIGVSDPLSVEVVLASGASALRLPMLTLSFALADLKGAIYYNTYSSALASNMGIGGGVVMRILPREPAPSVFAVANESPDQCIGCHSVSADGSRMVAEVHSSGGIVEGLGRSFDLKAAGGGVNPTPIRSDLRRAGFSAVYPDGSRYLTTGRTTDGVGMGASFTGAPTNITGTFGAEETKLFDMQSGAELASTGIHPYAYMPSFAVDGTQIVFNKMDMSASAGHTLAVMDFSAIANTFSNLRDVFSDPMGFPSWPFFLPDVIKTGEVKASHNSKRVLFALNTNADFLTGAVNFDGSTPSADLWWLDLDTGMAAALNRANGLDATGKVYLPYGDNDARKNFVPTVSPVAAGGYFWVFFSSRRSYGNTLVLDPTSTSPEQKKIWVAAIDIGAPPGTDASHPAFYLPNQELESGNIRAFAALEPCRAEGSACTSGVDCCCGYCLTDTDASMSGQCGCEPPRCSKLDERCDTAADCCDPAAACIGGFCEIPVVE